MSGTGTSKTLCPCQQALAGIARKPSCSQPQVGFGREGELGVSIPLGLSLFLQCSSLSSTSCSFLTLTSPGLSGAGTDTACWTCGMSPLRLGLSKPSVKSPMSDSTCSCFNAAEAPGCTLAWTRLVINSLMLGELITVR